MESSREIQGFRKTLQTTRSATTAAGAIAERLAVFRANPRAWAEFASTIRSERVEAGHRPTTAPSGGSGLVRRVEAQRGGGVSFVEANKAVAGRAEREAARAKWVATHEARLEAAAAAAAARERELVAARAALLAASRGVDAHTARAEARRKRRVAKAKPWLVLIAMARRLEHWKKAILEGRDRRARIEARVRTIQNFWRSHRLTRLAREAHGVDTLERALGLRLLQRRVADKVKATRIVVDVLQEFEDVNDIVKFVKRFRSSAMFVQSAWRKARARRSAQVKLITRAFDVVERRLMAEARERASALADSISSSQGGEVDIFSSSGSSKGGSSKGGKSGKLGKQKRGERPDPPGGAPASLSSLSSINPYKSVPQSIKGPLIEANLRARVVQHLDNLEAYHSETLAAWNRECKSLLARQHVETILQASSSGLDLSSASISSLNSPSPATLDGNGRRGSVALPPQPSPPHFSIFPSDASLVALVHKAHAALATQEPAYPTSPRAARAPSSKYLFARRASHHTLQKRQTSPKLLSLRSKASAARTLAALKEGSGPSINTIPPSPPSPAKKKTTRFA